MLEWVPSVPAALPAEMQEMAGALVDTIVEMARRLVELGLGYLALDRAGSTLSTGERQRAQLARAVRNRTTGVIGTGGANDYRFKTFSGNARIR